MHVHYSISLAAMHTDAQIRNVIEDIQQNADILNVSRSTTAYSLQPETQWSGSASPAPTLSLINILQAILPRSFKIQFQTVYKQL